MLHDIRRFKLSKSGSKFRGYQKRPQKFRGFYGRPLSTFTFISKERKDIHVCWYGVRTQLVVRPRIMTHAIVINNNQQVITHY